MSRFLPTFTALLVLLLLHDVVPTHALPKKPERWIELQSEHFTFYSSAGERAAQRIAADLELLHEALSQLTARSPNVPLPTYVYLFRDDRDFKPYKNLYQGKPANIAGFFLGREHANYIALDASSPDRAADIVYHEYIHYYLHSNYPALPLWLDEGLAELYSTFDTVGGTANVGKPVSRHILWLRSGALIPLPELLAVDRSSPTYNEGTRQGSFYAQSWALAHYCLIGNPERRPQLERFLTLIGRNTPQDEAFQTAFETDYATLEHELRTYVRRFAFYYSRQELPEKTAAVGLPRSLPAHETYTRLGDLLAYQQDGRPEAAGHYQAAVAAAPEYAPALTGMAYLAERTARHDEAREFYRRAAASPGASVNTLFRTAQHLLQRDGAEHAGESLPLLERCVGVRPEFGPCWVLLAYAHTFDEEPPEEALRAGWQAHQMFPDRVDVARNLLHLAVRRGDRDAAQNLVDGYFASRPERELRLQAERTLVQMDVQQAYDLINAGDFEEASQWINEVELRVANVPGLGMADTLAELKEGMTGDLAIGHYNQALVHVRAGEHGEAITRLEKSLATDPDGPVAQSSRDLLEHLRTRPEEPVVVFLEPEPSVAGDRPQPTAAGSTPSATRKLTNELNQLLARGRLDEARALLEAAREKSEHVNDRYWIDHRLEEIRKVSAHNRFVDRYNRAVELANAHYISRAIKLLEELIRETPDETQVEEARALLERIRSR